jgi:uncharacterized protein (DUF924 family)
MPVKLLTDSVDATITDEDQVRIDAVLSFWFREQAMSAPQIDRRMETWFSEDPVFDLEIEKEFINEVELASKGSLDHWARLPQGRLALIIMIDQFRRNIYRNTADAFSNDKQALRLCVEGAMQKMEQALTPIQKVFFYMPLQHAESRKVQAKSAQIFHRLAQSVSKTERATFMTVAQFAELHKDIIDRFGRFPHRNKLLNRENTAEENEYLADDNPSFGQG